MSGCGNGVPCLVHCWQQFGHLFHRGSLCMRDVAAVLGMVH